MKRGRKKGSVQRWTPFQDAQIWSRITYIRQREGLDVRGAARRLAYEGYFQVRNGKVWVTRPPRDDDKNKAMVDRIQELARIGDARQEDPAEVFRARYYIAERRRRTDAAFRSDCKFWLRVHTEKEDTDVDPVATFLKVMDEMNKDC